jgi:hypothetical protein
MNGKQTIETNIEGQVSLRDAEKCGNYYSYCNCLLATTLKRMFPSALVIEVYPRAFQIDGEFYEISAKLNNNLRKTYDLKKDGRLADFIPFDFAAEILN